MTRVAVFGAGLIGAYVGGRLAAAGAEVTLIGRQRLVEETAAHGLKLSDMHGYEASVPGVHVATAPEAAADADLVLVAVKSMATGEAGEALRPQLKSGTPVLSLQNGVSNAERLAAALPGVRVLAGMVPFNVAKVAPGHYHQGTGSLIAADPAMKPFAALFAKAGLPLALQDDMLAVMWGKLVINLNNAVNALSGLTLRQQLAQRDYRRCVALSQFEALRLLRRVGIRPAKVLAVPTWAVPIVFALPDRLYRRVMARNKTTVDKHARSSMADDLAQGRLTEVDYLNGEVAALAARLGRRAPVNSRIVELVRAAEAGAAPWPADRLLAELRRAG
jgi:2-dehydropantoate 2-reductase